jgi:DNA-binding GntR family transcriptional regulator
MIIDRDSAVPVWRQVAVWLAGQIKTAGQRMPSESTIEQELGVSIRHAYRFLADQGWVIVVSGKGAFAANPLPKGRPQV